MWLAQKISDTVSRQAGWGLLSTAGMGAFLGLQGGKSCPGNALPECLSSDRCYRGPRGLPVARGPRTLIEMGCLSVELNVCLTHPGPESPRFKMLPLFLEQSRASVGGPESSLPLGPACILNLVRHQGPKWVSLKGSEKPR